MNRLTHKAPLTVTIDDIEYKINTNFRDCLLTIQALQNSNLTTSERLEILLYNLYEETPQNVNKAVEMAIWFLRCGKKVKDEYHNEKLCDFDQDADYIYSAILKKGIDLEQCDNLHWWTFMSYFSEIEESTFSRIVYLRSKKNKGKLTKEEREECERIGWEVINFKDDEFELQQKEIEEFIFSNS